MTIGPAARVDLKHKNVLQHVAQSGAQVYTWQKTELVADAQVHQEQAEPHQDQAAQQTVRPELGKLDDGAVQEGSADGSYRERGDH